MVIDNSSGKIYYGMHFVPGVAQYSPSESDPQRIFINEATLRKLDPTFAGKPVFVDHVMDVASSVDKVKEDADGWVVESFFNAADGKHWVKFIIVSSQAEQAIQSGYRLSNAYVPQLNNKSGNWNAVPFQNEVIGGTYEHLAIVKNPRYEESVILTPEKFKSYNENLNNELKRISNSKEEKTSMLKFWNRKPVENAADFASTFVTLDKSKKTYSIEQIVNAMDEVEEKKNKVTLNDGTICTLSELLDKHNTLLIENAKMKKNKEEEEKELAEEKKDVEVEGDKHNEYDEKDEDKDMKKEKKENEEDDEEEGMKKEKAEAKKEEMKNKKKNNFDSLKNAQTTASAPAPNFDSIMNKVARGKARYGSK